MRTATLQAWMDEHGPLGEHEAALVALGCASTLMRSSGRTRNVRQIDPAHVERGEGGQWTWRPERSARGLKGGAERESVIAIGRLLHALLTGTPPGTQALVPVDLRQVRPDVQASLAVLVADAVGGETSLDQLCADLQAIAGVRTRRPRLPASFLWTVAVLLLVGGAVSMVGRGESAAPARLDPDTGLDLEGGDALWEASFGLAWMDEQSSAIEFAQALVRDESERLGYDSARVWRRLSWIAWLSQQRNDYLTAEQFGQTAQERLSALLGTAHPYALSAANVQISTLQQRGAWDAARARVSTLWNAWLEQTQVKGARIASGQLPEADLRQWRLDRDADRDGLADLVERLLGTDATVAAGPTDTIDGRPARSYALATNPGMVAAHRRGRAPWMEGFSTRASAGQAATPVHVLASVQRGYAERFGWLLRVDADAGACAIDLDTGTSPRRLHVTLERKDEGWQVSTGGTERRLAADPGPLSLIGDYDAPSRTIHWWAPGTTSWQTPFDSLPSTGPGPYGLWLLGASSDTCGSVTWTLRHAEVAPL